METCPSCHRPFALRRRRCYYCTGRKPTGETRACVRCGTVTYYQPKQVASGEGVYCSKSCQYATMRGRELRRGSTYVTKIGYRVVKVGIRQYKLEHRLVVETAIGRVLSRREEVHHVNGHKLDNRLENLLVLSPSEHQKHHPEIGRRQRRRITLTCEHCGTTFERRPKLIGQRFCSRSCRSTAIQLGRHRKA